MATTTTSTSTSATPPATTARAACPRRKSAPSGAWPSRLSARWAAGAGRGPTSCCAPATRSPFCWRSIPRPARRTPRPGPCPPPRGRPAALSAGDQYRAGHDGPLAGADVGARGGHQLRRPVPALAGHGHAGYAARRLVGSGARMTMTEPLAQPLDVKLMNLTASVLYLGCALCVLAALLWWLLRYPGFAIARIVVQGELVHNDAVTLRANVAPHLAGNFFTVDLRAARAAFEQAPWVRLAQVRRWYPGSLLVQLQEHDALAYWGPESGSALVNRQGEVFEANVGDVEPEGLPRLQGPSGSSAQVLQMHGLLQPVFESLGLRLQGLELTGRGGWRATLDNEAVVELGGGRAPQVLQRTQRFTRPLGQVAGADGRAKPGGVRRAGPGRVRRARPRQRTTQPTRAETDMAREHSKDVVVGLDIGTAKVMVVVAEVLPQGELKIAGLGVAPSNGLKRGVVVNIDATVQSIQQALKEAELMADCKIQRVYTGITGSHIR